MIINKQILELLFNIEINKNNIERKKISTTLKFN